jgi:uncharacterized protein
MNQVTVVSLHEYPIKGCRGRDLQEMNLDPDRLTDRMWMIVDATTNNFLSQRQLPAMARIDAEATAGGLRLTVEQRVVEVSVAADAARRRVTVWDDAVEAFDAGDEVAELLSQFLGRSVRLVRHPGDDQRVVDEFWTRTPGVKTSFADLGPMLVTTVESLAELNRRRDVVGLDAVPMSRFRPNIVVAGLHAFEEDRVGLLIRLIKPCARCKVTEIDQGRGVPMKDGVLDTLAGFRTMTNARGKSGILFGQNAISSLGRVRVGDVLRVGNRQDGTR